MRHALWSVICIACIAIACDDRDGPIPTSPSPTPTTESAEPPPAVPRPVTAQPTDGVPMAVGETLTSQVTTDDPLCSPAWPHRCRHFRLTAPRDGVLEVVMTCPSAAHAYVVDIGIIDPSGQMWYPLVEGAQRSVQLPVTAGATYVVEIWSSSAPGEVFELTSSLQPR